MFRPAPPPRHTTVYTHRTTTNYDFSTDTSGLKALAGPLWLMALTPLLGGLFTAIGNAASKQQVGDTFESATRGTTTRAQTTTYATTKEELNKELAKLNDMKNTLTKYGCTSLDDIDKKIAELANKIKIGSASVANKSKMKIKGSDDKPITKKDDLITYIESITNSTLTAEQESMIPENCSDGYPMETITAIIEELRFTPTTGDTSLANALENDSQYKNYKESLEKDQNELKKIEGELNELIELKTTLTDLGGIEGLDNEIATIKDQIANINNYERAQRNLERSKDYDVKQRDRKIARQIRRAIKQGDYVKADRLAQQHGVVKGTHTGGWYELSGTPSPVRPNGSVPPSAVVTTSSGGGVTTTQSGGISIPSSAPSTLAMTAAELENRLDTIPFYSACTVTVNDGTFIVEKSGNTIAKGSAEEVMRKFENELGWKWNPQTKKFEANLTSTVLSRRDNKGITQVKIGGKGYNIGKNFGLSNDLKSIKVENSSYTRGSSEPKTIEYKQVANGYYAKGDELYRFSHLDATQQNSAGATLNFEKVTFDSLPIGTTAKYESGEDYVVFTKGSGEKAQTIQVPIEQAEDFQLQLLNLFKFNSKQVITQNADRPDAPLTFTAGTAESFAPNELLSNAITEKFSDLAGFVETPELSYDAQSVTMYGVKITDFGQLGKLVGELTKLKSGNADYTVSNIVITDNETFTITLKKAAQEDKTEDVKLSKTPEIYDELGEAIAQQLAATGLDTIKDASYENGKIKVGNQECDSISTLNQELEKYGRKWNPSTQKVEPYLVNAYFTAKKDSGEDVTVKVDNTELTISRDNNDNNTANQFVATGDDGTRYTFKKVGDEYQLASIVDKYGIEAEIKSQITPELKSINDEDGIQFNLPAEQELPTITNIDVFIDKINTSLDAFGSEVNVDKNETDNNVDDNHFKIGDTECNMEQLVKELKNKGYTLNKATGEVTLVEISKEPIKLTASQKESLYVTKDGGKEFSFGLKDLNDSEKAILGVYNFDKTSKGLDGYEAGHAFKDYQNIDTSKDGKVSKEEYAKALEGLGYEHLRGVSYNDYDGFAKKLIGNNELLLNDGSDSNVGGKAYKISANNGGMKFEETAEIKQKGNLSAGTRKMDNEFRTVAHENGIEEITYRENGIHIITFSGESPLSVEIKVKNAEELKETLMALKDLGSNQSLKDALTAISLPEDSGYTTVINADKGTIEYYLNDQNNGRSDTPEFEVKIADAQSFKTQLSELYGINNQLPDGYKVQLIQNQQGKFKLGNQNVEMGSISSNALNVALSKLGITLSDNNSTPDQNKTISVVNNIAELQKNTNLTLPEKLVLSNENYEKLVNDMALFSKLVNDSGCRLKVVQHGADDYTLNILGSDNSPISFDDLKSKVNIDDITVNGGNFDIKLNNSETVSATKPLNALLELAKAGIELPITGPSAGIVIENTAPTLDLNTGKFSYTIGGHNYDIDIKDAKSFVTQYNQFSELNNILPDSNKLSLTQADGKLKIGEKEVEVGEIINEATNAVKTMTSCPSLKYDQEKDAFFVDSTQLTPEALACLIEFKESKQDTNYEVTEVAIESGNLSITYKYKDNDNDNGTKEETKQFEIPG